MFSFREFVEGQGWGRGIKNAFQNGAAWAQGVPNALATADQVFPPPTLDDPGNNQKAYDQFRSLSQNIVGNGIGSAYSRLERMNGSSGPDHQWPMGWNREAGSYGPFIRNNSATHILKAKRGMLDPLNTFVIQGDGTITFTTQIPATIEDPNFTNDLLRDIKKSDGAMELQRKGVDIDTIKAVNQSVVQRANHLMTFTIPRKK